jgi:spore maturation protein CgeB
MNGTSAAPATGRIPRRVLIVGADYTETVGDSYRRCLEGHYEVRLVDPTRLRGLPRALPQRVRDYITAGASAASNALVREPYALGIRAVLHAVRELRPDVVLVSHVTALPPKAVDEIRSLQRDCVIIGVFSDHIANLGRGYCFTADYDALFFKDRYMVEKFRSKLGWKHVWYLPQACDPAIHRPVELTDADRERYGCDLTLAGNMNLFRAAELKPLATRDFKMWGAHPGAWFAHDIMRRHQGRFVAGDEKCKAMLAAKIVINANHFAEIAGTNKRTFEVAAMGAFQLTDTPALADIFEPDVEVATWSSGAELLEKIDHYLARPEQRREMAERARQRAHREHTFAHRWAAKMGAVGLGVPPGFPVQPSNLAVRAA